MLSDSLKDSNWGNQNWNPGLIGSKKLFWQAIHQPWLTRSQGPHRGAASVAQREAVAGSPERRQAVLCHLWAAWTWKSHTSSLSSLGALACSSSLKELQSQLLQRFDNVPYQCKEKEHISPHSECVIPKFPSPRSVLQHSEHSINMCWWWCWPSPYRNLEVSGTGSSLYPSPIRIHHPTEESRIPSWYLWVCWKSF